ncbi:S26 family signal peptidase [Agrobacterium sp. S2/73]|uniref:S26 family signal peptidase n=1 Tax=unclassified Agrobacterium TaxID=2632611 RepID=UPI001ADB8473|nr:MULTISPECIES: S26 family signal peptidase [unclassified Agrobacterium]MBO9107319.1 S26 family signal peptidase [Agrobacterium sp. S2/73]QXZ72095.1 S26 family signal peptidase [Agrobacterium sp. S7/73]
MTRLGYAITTTAAASLLGILSFVSFVSFAPKLIWNASASTPIGLYAIEADQSPDVTDLVAVNAPEPLASFLADGGYLPRGVPLLKRVAALPEQRVCRTGLAITVDGVPMGDALDHDRRGRPLPIWQGCRLVANGELFLMNWQVRDSLDGRYFGPLPATAVIGRATPLYTDEDGDGRFVWRAPTR